MDTKLKSDIAESSVITELLKHQFGVLKPVGDRLPYDLVIEHDNEFKKIQIKSAWVRNGIYIVDSRRTKTNRRRMVRDRYTHGDFDYAVLYVEAEHIFYIMPFKVFNSYKSEITLRGNKKYAKPIRSDAYKNAWHLLK